MKELEDGERTSLYTWKPSNFSEFWGKTLEDGKNGKLGAKRPEVPVTEKVFRYHYEVV